MKILKIDDVKSPSNNHDNANDDATTIATSVLMATRYRAATLQNGDGQRGNDDEPHSVHCLRARYGQRGLDKTFWANSSWVPRVSKGT